MFNNEDVRQQIVELKLAGDSFRSVASALGVSRSKVERVWRRWQAEQDAAPEADAGSDARPVDYRVLNDRTFKVFYALSDEEKAAFELNGCLADLAEDPLNPLATFRLGHIPLSTVGHPYAA